jgi:hypothetical protein
MVQEELTRDLTNTGKQTFMIAIKALNLTEELLVKTLQKLIDGLKKGKAEDSTIYQGKQSVKQLVGSGDSISSIEITDKNIKSFEKTARQYGVDFSLKKNSATDPPTWMVFFKAKDADVMMSAFKDYTGKVLKKQQQLVKKAVTLVKKPGVLDMLKAAKERAAEINRDKKEKAHNKGEISL